MLAMREIRAIHHQGVYAVAAAFRQLYEMIEIDDERVHKLVCLATAAHLHRIEQLTGRRGWRRARSHQFVPQHCSQPIRRLVEPAVDFS